MIMRMSRALKSKSPVSAPRESPDEQPDHLLPADRVDADGHADLDRARHDGSDLHLHHDQRPDRVGGAEAVHRHRQFRDHGDPVLHSRRYFLTHGGVARRMINFATSMVGHWHGGLGLAGVMACALFAAVSGSSPATVIAIGSIMMPAMVRQGFPQRFGARGITPSRALRIPISPSLRGVISLLGAGRRFP